MTLATENNNNGKLATTTTTTTPSSATKDAVSNSTSGARLLTVPQTAFHLVAGVGFTVIIVWLHASKLPGSLLRFEEEKTRAVWCLLYVRRKKMFISYRRWGTLGSARFLTTWNMVSVCVRERQCVCVRARVKTCPLCCCLCMQQYMEAAFFLFSAGVGLFAPRRAPFWHNLRHRFFRALHVPTALFVAFMYWSCALRRPPSPRTAAVSLMTR